MLRRWALRKKLFDIPNQRSSHKRPTVRGGGLMIVLVNLSFYFLYNFFYAQNFSWLSLSYLTGAILIALISWLDDLYSISIIWRFSVHALAAILIISAFSQQIEFGNSIFLTSLFTAYRAKSFYYIICFFWIVWMTNAYNFMDGIDGIAALQAITAGCGWLLIGKLLDAPATAIYGGVLASACLGFIIHNWQPAKIFMGDVGSAFLGFTFAALPFLAFENVKVNFEKLYLTAIILVWLFLFDTIFTFGRRLIKGEKVWQAHRSHIYQELVVCGYTHKFVTILYGTFSFLNIALILVTILHQQSVYFLFTEIALETVFFVIFAFIVRKKNILQK